MSGVGGTGAASAARAHLGRGGNGGRRRPRRALGPGAVVGGCAPGRRGRSEEVARPVAGGRVVSRPDPIRDSTRSRDARAAEARRMSAALVATYRRRSRRRGDGTEASPRPPAMSTQRPPQLAAVIGTAPTYRPSDGSADADVRMQHDRAMTRHARRAELRLANAVARQRRGMRRPLGNASQQIRYAAMPRPPCRCAAITHSTPDDEHVDVECVGHAGGDAGDHAAAPRRARSATALGRRRGRVRGSRVCVMIVLRAAFARLSGRTPTWTPGTCGYAGSGSRIPIRATIPCATHRACEFSTAAASIRRHDGRIVAGVAAGLGDAAVSTPTSSAAGSSC